MDVIQKNEIRKRSIAYNGIGLGEVAKPEAK